MPHYAARLALRLIKMITRLAGQWERQFHEASDGIGQHNGNGREYQEQSESDGKAESENMQTSFTSQMPACQLAP